MDTDASAAVTITFHLNGSPVTLDALPWESGLDVIRRLGFTGAKEGCGIGECGACTIVVDGLAVDSCLVLAPQLDGRVVETVEGIGSEEHLHPLQQEFLEHAAVQCGFCTPGMIMAAKALLDENPNASREQIIDALAGNLCRCTGYAQILEAVEAVHWDSHNGPESRWGRHGGGDGLPLHPHRAQGRLKPGEPLQAVEAAVAQGADEQ